MKNRYVVGFSNLLVFCGDRHVVTFTKDEANKEQGDKRGGLKLYKLVEVKGKKSRTKGGKCLEELK